MFPVESAIGGAVDGARGEGFIGSAFVGVAVQADVGVPVAGFGVFEEEAVDWPFVWGRAPVKGLFADALEGVETGVTPGGVMCPAVGVDAEGEVDGGL